jgi:hypothetical protein
VSSAETCAGGPTHTLRSAFLRGGGCTYLPIRFVTPHVLRLKRLHHDEHELEIVEQPQLLCALCVICDVCVCGCVRA